MLCRLSALELWSERVNKRRRNSGEQGSADTPLTPREVANRFGVSPVTVRSWADKGWLRAETTPGGHRRFLLSEVARFARGREHTRSHPNGAALRVLIVDDDRQFTAYLQDLLDDRPTPIVLEIAHDGFEAGTKVQTFQPHVLLLDLMMPGVDGFEVCRRVKADPRTSAIRIIAMTGYHVPENAQRICAAGAEVCLKKPLPMDALLGLLGCTPTSLEGSA